MFVHNMQALEPKGMEENIRKSLKFFIRILQCLGYMPLKNISNKNMTFQWRNWKLFLTVFWIGFCGSFLMICCIPLFKTTYTFKTFIDHLFYSQGLLTPILYLKLAHSWPEIMRQWSEADKIMNIGYGYPRTLNSYLKIVAVLFCLSAVVENGLSICSNISTCLQTFGSNYSMEDYYTLGIPIVFDHLPFSPALGIYSSVVTIFNTITWAINDLFIILISIALALRFKQIAARLKSIENTVMSNIIFWKEIREDYDRLSELCHTLDKHLSYIILLSYTLNMFLLLVQLFHSLEEITQPIRRVYFIYSFAYLIGKLVTVTMFAAWVNEESKEPLNALNSVPTANYNVEVKRLINQIGFDNVALTGWKMFKITRGLILQIAGALVTYELMLIQFNTITRLES